MCLMNIYRMREGGRLVGGWWCRRRAGTSSVVLFGRWLCKPRGACRCHDGSVFVVGCGFFATKQHGASGFCIIICFDKYLNIRKLIEIQIIYPFFLFNLQTFRKRLPRVDAPR